MQIALVRHEKLASKATSLGLNKLRSRLSNGCITKVMHSACEQKNPRGTAVLNSNKEVSVIRMITMWRLPARRFGIHTFVAM
jgi:hypothetical protein